MVTPLDEGDGATPVALFVHLFFDELVRSGLTHVCVSPGSRSTPLTVAAYRTPGLHCSVHLDERAAAFFAVGLARRTRQAVALICTSGTAAANYLPALAEAREARVPLVVLTADRPPELRACGAGQTIDQLKLYGAQVKHFVEVAIGPDSRHQHRFARTLAGRAVTEAMATPAGPVHLNWPLREPFDLGVVELSNEQHDETAEQHGAGLDGLYGRSDGLPYVSCSQGGTQLTAEQLAWWQHCVDAHPRGVILCGGLEPDPSLCVAIAQLAEVTGWPVLADPLSQMRCGEQVRDAPLMACGDWLLRDASFGAACQPEVVVHLGMAPVSKALRMWLAATPPQHLLAVASDLQWQQPDHLLSAVFRVDPLHFCHQLGAALGAPRQSPWRDALMHADRAVAALLRQQVANEPRLLASRAVLELAELLPERAAVYVSNSMPVRDLDAFLPLRHAALDIYCNRGVNGIDGVLSSALGAAAASGEVPGAGDTQGAGGVRVTTECGPTECGPLTLLIGDLALLHDIGALLTAHQLALNITIIVFNNDGGAIFSYLPIAAEGAKVGFDELFTVPHGLQFGAAASLYGLSYHCVDSWSSFREAVREAQSQTGAHLIEVPVVAAAALSQRRTLSEHVAGVLAELPGVG